MYNSTILGDIATVLSQTIINAIYCNYYKVSIKALKHELFTLYITEALRYKSGLIPDGVGNFH
jgi:hypothetical protein